MNKFTATLPNGETVTRSSKTRSYTHAVAAKGWSTGGDEEWAVLNWCGSFALAQKAAEAAHRGGRSGHWVNVEIIEAN